MLQAVEGIFINGKVELNEIPQCTDGTSVVVTFLPNAVKPAGKMITAGMMKGMFTSPTEEDFAEAKYSGDRILEKWDKANRAE